MHKKCSPVTKRYGLHQNKPAMPKNRVIAGREGKVKNHRLEGQDRCELERLKVVESPEPTVQGVSQLASL